MNPKLKALFDALKKNKYVVFTVKHAVNAAIGVVVPMLENPEKYHFHSWSGVWHTLTVFGGAIAAREVAVWLPILLRLAAKLLQWSSSVETPNGNGSANAAGAGKP